MEFVMNRNFVIAGILLFSTLAAVSVKAAENPLGFKTEYGEINKITLFITKYVGECPGWSTPNTKGWFFSNVEEISSAKGRKIRFVNPAVSGGDKDVTRSFKEDNVSKKIEFRPYEEFRINEGENEIQFDLYEKDNDTPIKQGSFRVLGVHKVTEKTRNAEVTTKEICLSGDTPCSSIETEVTRACPGGQVLEQFKVQGRYNPGSRGSSSF